MELDDLPKERLKELIFNETTIFKQGLSASSSSGGATTEGESESRTDTSKEDSMQTN